MAREFKDLGTVDAVSSVSDNANVLIEEDGVIKRTPKSNVGGGGGGFNGVNVEVLVLHYTTENGYHPVSSEDYERIYNAILNDVPVIIWLFETYTNEYGTFKTQYFMYENYINVDDVGYIVIETYYDDYTIYPDGSISS